MHLCHFFSNVSKIFAKSRLNEISEGCQIIVQVSGSFRSKSKFYKMMLFTVWLCGRKVISRMGAVSFPSDSRDNREVKNDVYGKQQT